MAKKFQNNGFLTEITEDVEKTRTIPFVLSTYTKDRHGTVLNQDKWMLDNYRRNPVVAYQHNLSGGFFTDPNPDFVIGKSESVGVEGSGKAKKLVALLKFEPASMNPLAETVFRKVLFGSLSRASVGFLEVGHGKYGPGDEARGKANQTYYLEGQELLEWSVVNIPSNPDAGKRGGQRSLKDMSQPALIYSVNKLREIFRPSEVEKMSLEEAELYIQAADLEYYEKNISKVRAFLSDSIGVRIRKEVLAYRKQRGIIVKRG